MKWRWPLAKSRADVPTGERPGAFGAVREHDRHTGVDLYCERHEGVRAVEEGLVVAVVQFTGGAESPWWNDTWAIMVSGESGVVLYGELMKQTPVTVGKRVRKGDWIGHVERVLKKGKGKPMDMLHLELYWYGTLEPVWWPLRQKKPEALLDPTDLLDNR